MRRSALNSRGLNVVAVVAVVAAGCAVPVERLEDPEAIEVRILATSTRVFAPGRGARFELALTNRSGGAIALSHIDVLFRVSPKANPDYSSLTENWRYPLPESVSIQPGRDVRFPLRPDPAEFRMATLFPGEYTIRATVFGRFESEPFEVRVERPDLGRRSGGT